MSKIPRLLAWGDDGLPGELKVYLKSIDGEGGVSQSEFMGEGVARVASEYRVRLQREKDLWAQSKSGQLPKLSHEIRSILYLLHAYCAQCEAPAPTELLWLTFESLDLKEESPSREIEQSLHDKVSDVIPVAVEKLPAFLEASALDGEADARGEELNKSQIARAVDVQRGTIRGWRQTKEYNARRRWAKFAWSANLAASPDAKSPAWVRAKSLPPKGGNRKV